MIEGQIKSHKELRELKERALFTADVKLWSDYQKQKKLTEEFHLEKHKKWLWGFRIVLFSIVIYLLVLFFEITHKWILGESPDLKDYAFVVLVFIWILRRLARRSN